MEKRKGQGRTKATGDRVRSDKILSKPFFLRSYSSVWADIRNTNGWMGGSLLKKNKNKLESITQRPRPSSLTLSTFILSTLTPLTPVTPLAHIKTELPHPFSSLFIVCSALYPHPHLLRFTHSQCHSDTLLPFSPHRFSFPELFFFGSVFASHIPPYTFYTNIPLLAFRSSLLALLSSK